ncbi:tetratricopeptide repeat protein [Streptomyces xiangluensis]|uniref:Tetratricopeptide repeat protein n=1 Tax=Streptomyces xiangluensis TaxID=2665720 RepID=A0ABV8ZAY0_9ACTN
MQGGGPLPPGSTKRGRKPPTRSREALLGRWRPACSPRAAIAFDHRRLGWFEEALALDQQVLADHERILGPDHPDTLWSHHHLAGDYRGLGRYQQALALDQQVLADRERVLRADHLDTLWSRAAIAEDYRGLGRHEEALALEQQVLADRERILGHRPTPARSAVSNYCGSGRVKWTATDRRRSRVRPQGRRSPRTCTRAFPPGTLIWWAPGGRRRAGGTATAGSPMVCTPTRNTGKGFQPPGRSGHGSRRREMPRAVQPRHQTGAPEPGRRQHRPGPPHQDDTPLDAGPAGLRTDLNPFRSRGASEAGEPVWAPRAWRWSHTVQGRLEHGHEPRPPAQERYLCPHSVLNFASGSSLRPLLRLSSILLRPLHHRQSPEASVDH